MKGFLIGLILVSLVVALIAWVWVLAAERHNACDAAGGVLVRGTCLEKSIVIEDF